jgi:ATP-dependent DNA helicase RecG
VIEILNIASNWIKIEDLFEFVKLSKHPDNRKKYLDPLLKIGWVEMEFPDKKTSPNQRYKITSSGKRLLKIINKNS